MQSQDNPDKDYLSLNPEDGFSASDPILENRTVVKPKRGIAAVRDIFTAKNSGTLKLVAFLAVFFLTALVYSFSTLDEPATKPTGVISSSARVNVSESDGETSDLERQQMEQYNQEQLPKDQQRNPNAHPLLNTENQTDVPPAPTKNPFPEKGASKNAAPTTSQAGAQQNNSAQRASNDKAAQSRERLITSLMTSEGATPELYAVTWDYASPVEQGYPQGFQEGEPFGEGSEGALSSTNQCANPIERAGAMAMATTDIALNSDVEGPVSVTIRNGRLRNAILIGEFERKDEYLRLSLKRMVLPDQTVPIEAIALDVETTLNAVSGDVDRHILYRYGWWGLGTVLKAYGAAGEAAAQGETYVSDGVVVNDVQADANDQLLIGLGSLGRDIGSVMQDRLNRPITVSLNVGDEVGVFFLNDVCPKNDLKNSIKE